MDSDEYREIHKRTTYFYRKIKSIYSPYFQENIRFNSEGFNHLQFSAGRERNRKEQILKYRLLRRYVLTILKSSGTVQEYRKSNGTEYWAFVAITDRPKRERVKVIVRKRPGGCIYFWSVMPAERHKGDESYIQ